MILTTHQKKFLDSFKKDVKLPLENISDISSWLMNVQHILANTVSLKKSKDPFVQKAQVLQGKFNHPLQEGEKVNVVALIALRMEMKTALQDKEKQLKALLSFHEMLSEIPPIQMEAFLAAIHLNCDKGIAEGLSYENAFAKALAYALSRALISTNDLEDKELDRYRCPIRGDVIESQPVYFMQRLDSQEEPRECYHEKDIREWLRQNPTDPQTRERRTIQDLRKDLKGKENLKLIVSSLIYPETNKADVSTVKTTLPTQSVFLAACLGYPLAKARYKEILAETRDYNKAAQEAEKIQSLAIDLFEPLLQEVKEDDLPFFKWQTPRAPKNQTPQAAQPIVDWPDYDIDGSEDFDSKKNFQTMEVQIQFMQAFLAHQVKNQSQGDSAKLKSQMQEYVAFVREVKDFDVDTSRKKECQDKALEMILEEETSSSSSSSKKRSFDSLRQKYSVEDPEICVKKTRLDPSDEEVQLKLLNRFFT